MELTHFMTINVYFYISWGHFILDPITDANDNSFSNLWAPTGLPLARHKNPRLFQMKLQITYCTNAHLLIQNLLLWHFSCISATDESQLVMLNSDMQKELKYE